MLVSRVIASGKVTIVSSILWTIKHNWFVCIELLIDARFIDVFE